MEREGKEKEKLPLNCFAQEVKQSQLKERGVELISEADESTTGPASFMVSDPDGNTILVDQHV